MNLHLFDPEGQDEFLYLLGCALARGPLSGFSEAQAAFDAAANERLSPADLAWLVRAGAAEARQGAAEARLAARESCRAQAGPSGCRSARSRSRRSGSHPLRAEALERRDATAPLWFVSALTCPELAWPGRYETQAEIGQSAFTSSDSWVAAGGPLAAGGALAAASGALLGGAVLAVWLNFVQRRKAPLRALRHDARAYDRALVELVEAGLVA